MIRVVMFFFVVMFAICFAAALIATAVSVRAFAHDAPTGWAYPFSCCSGVDCRPVKKEEISERPEGFIINATGEVVGYQDTRLKQSPDGEYHWCSVAGANDSRTICLYVPPRAF